MAGMAKALIIGNVGRDPEQRYSQQGNMMVSFSVAVNNRRRQPDGSFTDETEWYRITATGRLAEICQQYVQKGKQVYVEGRLRADRWTGQDGQPRTTLDIFASDLQLLGSREQGEGGYDRPSSGEGFDRTADRPSDAQPAPARAPNRAAAPAQGMDQSDLEDLPF